MAYPIVGGPFQSGEANKTLIFPQTSTGPNLSGAGVSVSFVVTTQVNGTNSYACTIVNGTPQYTLTGVEFPEIGVDYSANVELIYSQGSTILKSIVGQIPINTSLA